MKYIMITEPKKGQRARSRFNSDIKDGQVIAALYTPTRLHIDIRETVTLNVACPHWNLVYTEDYVVGGLGMSYGMWYYRLIRDLGEFGFGHRFSACYVKGLVVTK